MSEADGFSQPRPVFCLWSLVGSPDLPTPGSATFRGIPVKVIQGNHSPGKPGKVREFQSGQRKVKENGKSQGE